MINKVIHLREDDPDITLTTYVADEEWKTRDAILVLPGGGYSIVWDEGEGEPIALSYLARGINAFVLRYSVESKAVYPRPLIDASLAIAYIKDHAEEFHINPERVFCVGFSAGAHLSAALGTLWHTEGLAESANIPFGKNKPAGMVLCYPVISSGDKAHKDSFYNILGTNTPNDEQLDLYSIEKHVDERTIPAFLMHTAEDPIVPVENSLYMAESLSKHKIPFEMHIYPYGPHGIALANWLTSHGKPDFEDAAIERWLDDSVSWIKRIKIS